MLEQLVYISALSPHVDDECLKDVLAESTTNNRANHVTGILLYVNGSFLQVLEGESSTIAKLFEKIRQDPRHKNVREILQVEIEQREFANWSMGWAQVGAEALDKIVDKSDFFTTGHCLSELSETQVKRVLNQFRQGRWRRRIQ